MLRDFITNGAKASNAMYKAKVNMTTGMAVVKEETDVDKFVNITEQETVADIYFVDKERVPTGINCAKGDMSDYDPDFVQIKANEPVTLDTYHFGEKLGTDQYDETITNNLAIGTRISFKNGKAMKSTIPSQYVFRGFHNDNGHMLVQIGISDTVVANA